MRTPSRPSAVLDLLPIAAFLAFWLMAGLLSALVTADGRLVALGVVTLPAVAAACAAAWRVRPRPPAPPAPARD